MLTMPAVIVPDQFNAATAFLDRNLTEGRGAKTAIYYDGQAYTYAQIEELTNRVEWDTRIFEERRKTMNFVCEVPVLIEQRLFALARAIQQSLE